MDADDFGAGVELQRPTAYRIATADSDGFTTAGFADFAPIVRTPGTTFAGTLELALLRRPNQGKSIKTLERVTDRRTICTGPAVAIVDQRIYRPSYVGW